MRSGPGSIRSKVVLPPGRAWRVSEGTPSKASLTRITISCEAVAMSSGEAAKSRAPSPGSMPMDSLSGWGSSLVAGRVVGQAMTLTRPSISSRNARSG